LGRHRVFTPSIVRDAVTAIVEAPGSDTLAVVIERFVAIAEPSLEPDCPWADAPVGIILRGLYFLARELRRTPEGQRPLVLCNAIRDAASTSAQFDGEPNELVAALMAVEDALSAIEGYFAFPPFAFVDEAYLAKYGLLQALQVGFDAAECVARVLGEKLRADKMPGGKVVLVARNIVAGHPIGGNMAGDASGTCTSVHMPRDSHDQPSTDGLLLDGRTRNVAIHRGKPWAAVKPDDLVVPPARATEG
jgi:hypothetical protein